MTALVTKDLVITKGKTFSEIFCWEKSQPVFKPITGITNTAPPTLTVTGHALPTGWRAAIVSVKGMTQLNADNNPPKTADYYTIESTGGNTLTLPEVNAADFGTYLSGGYLLVYPPEELTGYDARMSIKDKVGGTELFSLTSANSRIIIDTALSTITLHIAAISSAPFTFTKGVYDLELYKTVGLEEIVVNLASGSVVVNSEVTT